MFILGNKFSTDRLTVFMQQETASCRHGIVFSHFQANLIKLPGTLGV